MEKQFYTYMWLREDGTPYYAGAGCGKRAFTNSGHTCRKPKDGSRIVVFPRNSWAEAIETEKELIANWGRRDLGIGCLRNFTDGGDGQVGRKYSEESRKKMRQAKLGTKNALGHIGKTGSSEVMSACARRGRHLQWHVRRGIVSPTCQLCEQVHA